MTRIPRTKNQRKTLRSIKEYLQMLDRIAGRETRFFIAKLFLKSSS